MRSPSIRSQATPDVTISEVLDILFQNPCIRAELRNSEEKKYDATIMKFIHILQDFRDIIKEKIYITGDEDRAFEKILRRTYKTNILLVRAVNGNFF